MKDIRQLGAKLTGPGGRATATQVDAAAIRELADLLQETGLGEIEIEHAGRRIRVARQGTPSSVATQPFATVPEPQPAPMRGEVSPRPTEGAVTSPMVGTVYVSAEPGKPPFVKTGDSVREGATLLIVEAMKTMNPIVAPRSGVVKEICVRDAQPVEFGQILILLGDAP